jgi:F-type H+-transporting ATPase subunit a
MFSPLEQFDVIPLLFFSIGNYDLSLFNIFIPLLLIISLMFSLYYLRSEIKLIPYSFQSVFENLTDFIFGIIKNQIGREGFLFLPFILTVFIFVLFANLLSVIPFGIALTSHLIVTM